MIQPRELERPEDELELQNREGEDRPTRRRPEAAEVRALRERLDKIEQAIARAKKLPLPIGGHCRDCWDRGRRAVLETIERE